MKSVNNHSCNVCLSPNRIWILDSENLQLCQACCEHIIPNHHHSQCSIRYLYQMHFPYCSLRGEPDMMSKFLVQRQMTKEIPVNQGSVNALCHPNQQPAQFQVPCLTPTNIFEQQLNKEERHLNRITYIKNFDL